ncbi:hypothetical protein MANI_027439 [Metarhizium anisopliae]|nr:hypothetical protein MANI_027439 [Metarhizium anisopliae]
MDPPHGNHKLSSSATELLFGQHTAVFRVAPWKVHPRDSSQFSPPPPSSLTASTEQLLSPLHSNSPNNIMAAINTALVAREAISTLVKRKSWPAENAGVMVVFCIVFVVAVGLIGLWIAKFLSRRREAKERAQAKY